MPCVTSSNAPATTSFFVTNSHALVTSSDALVTSSDVHVELATSLRGDMVPLRA